MGYIFDLKPQKSEQVRLTYGCGLQTFRLDQGMPNVSPWTWACTTSFFCYLAAQAAGPAHMLFIACLLHLSLRVPEQLFY